MSESAAIERLSSENDEFVDVSRTGHHKGNFGMLQNDLEWVRKLNIHNPMMKMSTNEVRSKIFNSSRVQQAMHRCQTNGKMTQKQCRIAANSILSEMVAAVRPSVLHPLGLAARPLCRYIYRGGINVNSSGIQRVKDALNKGPVILLPVHRSHLDYFNEISNDSQIAIQFASVANGLPVPFVIAGDNLNFPIIGRILKNAGAVFIRRSFGADLIYWAVFTEYMSQILQSGCLLECFIEGGRSRNGKSIQPKSGFLEVIVQLLAEGAIADVTLIPVGIAYDRMVEGKSFVKEMLGSNKEQESLAGFLQASAEFLKMHLGSVDITISDKVFSMKSYMSTAKYQLNSDKTDRSRFISALSHMILYEANLVTTVTASSLVAAVLLTSRTRGITRATVTERVSAIIDDLRSRNAPLSRLILTQPLSLVVDGALNLLGRLVTNRNGVLFGYWHMESLELGIYRNAVIHWWASEAIVAVALVAVYRRLHYKLDGESTAGVSKESTLEKVRFVSQLLKSEFIYKPSFNIENNFAEIIAELKARMVLGEGKDGVVYIRGRHGLKYISFLCMLIWPLIDVYYVCCTTLMSLPRSTIIQESALVAKASAAAEASYYKGEMAFYESVSTDSIKHTLKWFENKGVIAVQPIIATNSHKPPKLYTLSPEYCPESDSTPSVLLRNLASSIKQFRAETPDVDQRHFTLSSRL